MKPLEELDERIRELLINHNWDINIYDFPDIVQEAKALGLDERQLNHKVMQIDSLIDKRPYALIDSLVEEPVSRGIIEDKDIEKALAQLGDKIPPSRVISYVIYKIRRHHFEPRNRIPLDWSSFKNPWMTNEAWKKYQETHLEVEWLGEKARTLEEMGEISFRKKEDAQYYFRNSHYLPPLVTILTKNAAKADGFARIIDSEPDAEARYLNLIYRLNPALAFRFFGKMYHSVSVLLDEAVQSADRFWALAQVYRNRHLHIWLNEVNAAAKVHLTTERDTNGFLTFIYSINNRYPFYLDRQRFDDPASLVSEARRNGGIWPAIVSVIENGNIRSWFAGLGQREWSARLESESSAFLQSDLYSPEDSKLAAVQTLINIIEPAAGTPAVEAHPPSISELSIEASKPVFFPVSIRLVNEGFLKLRVLPDQPVEGITIDRDILVFYGQEGKKEEVIQLGVNPMKLVKNKKYELTILLRSVYGTTQIPVAVKVVFPKKAFLVQLGKYAALGALLFAGIGFFIQMIAASLPLSTEEPYLALDPDEWFFPLAYLLYIVPVVLLAVGLIFSISLIRKIEKI